MCIYLVKPTHYTFVTYSIIANNSAYLYYMLYSFLIILTTVVNITN